MNLLNAVYGGVTSAVIALVPLYAINRYGIGALDSSALLVAQGVAAIILSIASTFALRRTGYRAPLYAGGAIMAAGMLLLAVKPGRGCHAVCVAVGFRVSHWRGTRHEQPGQPQRGAATGA